MLTSRWAAAAKSAAIDAVDAVVPIHKDFHAGHVLVGASTPASSIFDEARMGDPAFDVAHFCTYLEPARSGRTLRRAGSSTRTPRPSGWVDEGSLAPFRAYTCLKIAKQAVAGSGPFRDVGRAQRLDIADAAIARGSPGSTRPGRGGRDARTARDLHRSQLAAAVADVHRQRGAGAGATRSRARHLQPGALGRDRRAAAGGRRARAGARTSRREPAAAAGRPCAAPGRCSPPRPHATCRTLLFGPAPTGPGRRLRRPAPRWSASRTPSGCAPRCVRMTAVGDRTVRVHAHFAHDPALVGLLAARLDRPAVQLHRPRPRPAADPRARASPPAPRAATALVTCCEANADYLARRGAGGPGCHRCGVIHHGVDLDRFAPVDPAGRTLRAVPDHGSCRSGGWSRRRASTTCCARLRPGRRGPGVPLPDLRRRAAAGELDRLRDELGLARPGRASWAPATATRSSPPSAAADVVRPHPAASPRTATATASPTSWSRRWPAACRWSRPGRRHHRARRRRRERAAACARRRRPRSPARSARLLADPRPAPAPGRGRPAHGRGATTTSTSPRPRLDALSPRAGPASTGRSR